MGCVINCHRNASAQRVWLDLDRGGGSEGRGEEWRGGEDQAVSLESTVL